MKSALAALAFLMVLPVVAHAESEYSACMKMQSMSASSFGGNRTSFAFSRRTYVAPNFGLGYGTNYYNYYPVPQYSYHGFSRLGGDNDRIVAMARACRHLRKTERPAYRVVAVKSPIQRVAVNEATKKPAAPKATSQP
jgi:hypothetical protein